MHSHRRITVALLDYGAGNLASVAQTLQALGLRCRASRDPVVLAAADVLLLPGVGAFPAAMQALRGQGLHHLLHERAAAGQAIVGICLGMQLLADSSSEQHETAGLGLVPGRVQALPAGGWHIGWNEIAVPGADPLLAPSDGRALYFNHAYAYAPGSPHVAALVRLPDGSAVPAAVRRGRTVGLQFHPEKSQAAGRQLLQEVLLGLVEGRVPAEPPLAAAAVPNEVSPC